MTMYVALLRGINVGNAKRIAMQDLRDLFGELGYGDVTTLLNSGNVVFNAPKGTAMKHATDIARAIHRQLKIEVPVIVKSAQDLAKIVAENSLAKQAENSSYLLVAFVQEAKALKALNVIEPLVVLPERFLIGKGAAYLDCKKGIHASKAGTALIGKAGQAVTTRNWATVLKLQAMLIASAL